MNLIEAVRSGKPFRRKMPANSNAEPSFWLTLETIKEMRYRFSIHSVLAGDWELYDVKEKVIKIRKYEALTIYDIGTLKDEERLKEYLTVLGFEE